MMNLNMWRMVASGGVCKEAWFFVRWGLLVTIVFYLAGAHALVALSLLVTGAVIFFFRDPHRIIVQHENGLVSPADGVVTEITVGEPPEELGLSSSEWKKIGIFMGPWHPHVQRIPTTGTITEILHKEGEFSHVFTQEVSPRNERNSIVIQTPEGHQVVCVQIAGFLARRIICDLEQGEEVVMGNKYGLICFGSHVDLYVPQETELYIAPGQRLLAGESFLGFLPSLS